MFVFNPRNIYKQLSQLMFKLCSDQYRQCSGRSLRLMLPCRPPQKFSIPKAVKNVSLGHIQKKEVGDVRSTDEGVKLPAVIAGWCNNTISPGFLRYICDVHFIEMLNKVWCTIFSTKNRKMFH